MHLTYKLLIFLTLLLLVSGCSQKEESILKLPEDIPDFVKETDFDSIDWDHKAVRLSDHMIGNENKSGVIGIDMPSLQTQKWMWHLWGLENPVNKKFTVIGYHREMGTVHQVLTSGWTIGLSGENNGADAHTPSNVQIPEAGEWAFLQYIEGELFDTLVYKITE